MAETPQGGDNPSQEDADKLMEDALKEAQSSLAQMQEIAGVPEFDDVENVQEGEASGIDLLSDVDLHVMIELGRTEMLVEDVLRLQSGSVVELDKLAGDPVDVYVNNRLIARGEVLVLNDNFCIRISEIVANLEEQAQAAAEQQVSATG